MRRGEIWWAEPAGAKRRPYLVLMRDISIEHVHRVICIPATTRERQLRTEVVLYESDGVPERCVLSADNVALIDHESFDSRICKLEAPRIQEVCRALAIATGCE